MSFVKCRSPSEGNFEESRQYATRILLLVLTRPLKLSPPDMQYLIRYFPSAQKHPCFNVQIFSERGRCRIASRIPDRYFSRGSWGASPNPQDNPNSSTNHSAC